MGRGEIASGTGGLHAAGLLAGLSPEVLLSDINEQALRFCRINAALNDIQGVATVRSDLYDNIEGRFDLILSNPPYLIGPLARLYRRRRRTGFGTQP
jgi:methylase of polypeptide subunit release factors